MLGHPCSLKSTRHNHKNKFCKRKHRANPRNATALRAGNIAGEEEEERKEGRGKGDRERGKVPLLLAPLT